MSGQRVVTSSDDGMVIVVADGRGFLEYAV